MLRSAELAVIRHLGVHCGAGGQVLLKRWQREAAVGPWRMGLIEAWLRLRPGAGVSGVFFGLTDRGKRLASSLLTPRQPRRAQNSVRIPTT